MNKIISVAIKCDNNKINYFITFGRLQSIINGERIEAIVLNTSKNYALDGNPCLAEVCYSLKDAAQSPYFYEAMQLINEIRIPTSKIKYEKWENEIIKGMTSGKYIYFCGSNNQRTESSKKFWSMTL